MSEASAEEVAQAINAEPAMTANQLRAVVVDGRVFLQSEGSGASESFTVTGGTASGVIGFAAATVANGHDTAVNVQISGSYSGSENQSLVFRPNMDGQIGTTPGLMVEVLNSDGLSIAILDVGSGYIPGNALTITDGVEVSFGFGHLSASDNDTFTQNLVADSDTSDVLVALGLNSFLMGTDAQTIAVRDDIVTDPDRIATSASGAAGDNGALLELMSLQQEPVESLSGTFNEFYGTIVGGMGFDISSTRNSLEVEAFIAGSLLERREQISGVNIDEELVNMIQHEQAFGAASRFIQVVNSLNDEILNLL
jgi:flagellar hook-associated protein 1 FlgK